MRQAGVLAAAGIIALTEQMARLAEDHDNAEHLWQGLTVIEELAPRLEPVQTNMVFIDIRGETVNRLTEHLKERGILVAGRDRLRLVTHLDVSAEDIARVVEEMKNFFR